jgi:hypothetical protein
MYKTSNNVHAQPTSSILQQKHQTRHITDPLERRSLIIETRGQLIGPLHFQSFGSLEQQERKRSLVARRKWDL